MGLSGGQDAEGESDLRSLITTLASVALAAGLAACQQQAEEPDTAAEAPADVTVVDPPDNVTVVKPDTPDVDIRPPDVNINPPDVDVNPPTTKESTTVTVPGVGSTTTTTEKR